MYSKSWFLRSKKPEEIASFETLVRPLEPSLWAFTTGFTILIFISLYTVQRLWSNLIGQQIPQGHLFQGINTGIFVVTERTTNVYISKNPIFKSSFQTSVLHSSWLMKQFLTAGFKEKDLHTLESYCLFSGWWWEISFCWVIRVHSFQT